MRAVTGLADALRVFEIHPGQCGVLVHVADAPASAFVVPHPDDYRELHATLPLDFYGELIHHYALFMPAVPEFTARLAAESIGDLADLRAAAGQEREWARFHTSVSAAGLLGVSYRAQRVYRMAASRCPGTCRRSARRRRTTAGRRSPTSTGRSRI